MNYEQLTLEGISARNENGTLIITRRVLKDEKKSIIDLSATSPNAMELCAVLPAETWQGAFWYPTGPDDDKNKFFRWVLLVRQDLVEYVKSSCQPRVLEKHLDDKSRYELDMSA